VYYIIVKIKSPMGNVSRAYNLDMRSRWGGPHWLFFPGEVERAYRGSNLRKLHWGVANTGEVEGEHRDGCRGDLDDGLRGWGEMAMGENR
jgi:hypothetical protein